MAQKPPTAKDLRALPEPEIHAELEKIRQERWSRRLKAKDGSLQQTHLLPSLKRQIARIQTILRERARTTTGQTP